MRFLVAVSVFLFMYGRVSSVHAEATQIGQPAHPFDVTLGDRDGHAELRAGSARVLLDLDSEGAHLALESFAIDGGARVVVARVVNGEARAAALLVEVRGSVRALWNGRTDLRGDLGERHASRIETRDRTGDGVSDIVLGETQENIRLCGQSPALLFARALDPVSFTLRPVSLMPFEVPANAPSIDAQLTSPGPTDAPRVPTLRVSAVSSAAGLGENPAALQPPLALTTPGRAVWSEGRGGIGRGEFVTAEWIARGLSVRALALTLVSATPSRGAPVARPSSVWIVGSAGAALHVRLPDAPAGARVWIVLPEAVHWSCLSVVLDEAASVDAAHQASARVSLAGLEAYSEIDFGARVESFIAALDEPGTPGENALNAVRAFGSEALAPLIAAFEQLGDQGKLRALELLAPGLEEDAGARAAVVQAASSPTEALLRAATASLLRAGPASRRELAALVSGDGQVADRVAAALAPTADAETMSAYLAALVADGGSERPALRLAILVAASRSTTARATLTTWAQSSPPVAAAAALAASARAGDGAVLDIAHTLVDGSYARAETFPDRYRIALAATVAGRDAELSPWLARQAAHAEEWMQRNVALLALSARRAADLPTAALASISDPYPRVRVTAVGVLPVTDQSEALFTARATRDSWPMVRSAALAALAEAHRGRDAALHALHDSQPSVRAAAIRALTELGARDAWPSISAMLLSDEEWPEVFEAGLLFARTLCIQNAADPIVAVLQRGLRPNAWAPDEEVTGLALNVAATLGGEAARDAFAIASRQTSPASLRGEATRLQAHPPNVCTPSAAN
ncbi:MAG: HEAT repeat domain-containing protein [Sandaracinaceae bacterium]|nr:HEAT repeat domain-containing protein [Sandaracinaceae bacterium]